MEKRYLGWVLGTESFAEENGVSVHEIAKTVLNTVSEYGFHGCFDLVRGRERDGEGFWFWFWVSKSGRHV